MKPAARLRLLCALVMVAPFLSACLEPERTTIAVMMSSTADESWSRVVWPRFKRQVNATCAGCEIETFDAKGDSAAQAAQLQQALRDKVDVIVLDAVTAETGERLVVDAGEVPVIAFHRFVPGADRAVTTPIESNGRSAVLGTDKGQRVAIVPGPYDEHDVAEQVADAQQALTDAGAQIVPVDAITPTKLRGLDLVLAPTADDVERVSSALDEVAPATRPRVVTFATNLATLRRLIAGEVGQSIFVAEDQMAKAAADVAVAIVTKEDLPAAEDYEGVPTVQFAAEPLRLSNLTSTLVKEGRYSLDELCDGETLKRCQALGLV